MATNQIAGGSIVRGDTNRPVCKSCGSPDKPNPDYVNLVNAILSNPNNQINPNDPIYQQALVQFNEQLAKGTTQRLSVPEGFCGYIDPDTGLFIVTPDPNTTILRPSERIPTGTIETITPIVSAGTPYPIDKCLEVGLPGSAAYAECTKNSIGLNNKPSGVNWVGVWRTAKAPKGSFDMRTTKFDPTIKDALIAKIAAFLEASKKDGENTEEVDEVVCDLPYPPSSGPEMHPPYYGIDDGVIILTTPERGFVSNPSNSRGKLKIVLPNSYDGQVGNLYLFTEGGGFSEIVPLYENWEEECRLRYYSAQAPEAYPKNLWVRWDTVMGDYAYKLIDPTVKIRG